MAAGGGSVINIGSMAGNRGFPLTAAYAASKGAVHALSRPMAADYGPHGIRVNTIVIGLVITELSAGVAGTPELAAGTVGLQFIPRLGQTADVANLAVYLGSDESTFITAGEFTVDGGSMMKGPMLAASFELGTLAHATLGPGPGGEADKRMHT
jgi:3alpha(or 20beta)-hydroxysteroid dehydrogenase